MRHQLDDLTRFNLGVEVWLFLYICESIIKINYYEL